MMAAPTLKTERLTLRNIEKSDAQHLKYLLKPEIEAVSGSYMPHSEAQLAQHVDRIRGNMAWGVILDDGTWIGDIGVFSIAEHQVGEIAWYMDPSYWNRGYAFEAATAVLRYAFETLGFVRVSAQIAEDNHASRHLAEKLGFDFMRYYRRRILAARWLMLRIILLQMDLLLCELSNQTENRER